jgi:hypothetical protein
MRQRREVSRDDKADDDHDHDDGGHRQRKVPLLAEGHPQLHAKLHAGEQGKTGLLRLRDRQALEQRVDSRLRPHSAHRKSGSASRESDQTGDGLLRSNELT